MSRKSSSSSVSTFSSLRDDDKMMKDCYELKRRLLQTQEALNQLGRSNTSLGSNISSARSSPRRKEARRHDPSEKEFPILTLEDLSPKSSSIRSESEYPGLDPLRYSTSLQSEEERHVFIEANQLPENGGDAGLVDLLKTSCALCSQDTQQINVLCSLQERLSRSLLDSNKNHSYLNKDGKKNDSLLVVENEKLRFELESSSYELQEVRAQLTNSQLCLEESLRSSGSKKKRIKELEDKLQEAHQNLRNQNMEELSLKSENDSLRNALAKQEEVLRELEGLCTNLQNAQTNFLQMQKAQTQSMEDAPERSPTNQSAVFAIAELRLQLAKQEAENQKLQSALNSQVSPQQRKTQDGNADHPKVSDIRTELSAVIERSRLGDRKQQELERIITYLEDEVSRYTNQVLDLDERLNDCMLDNAKLEDKLAERNTRIATLVKQLEDRSNETSTVELKVNQYEAESARLRDELSKKESELEEYVLKVEKLDKMIEEKQQLVIDAEEALGLKENESKQVTSVIQKIKLLHAEHCKELEQQIELLQQRLGNKTNQLAKLETALSSLRQDLNAKESMSMKLLTDLEDAQKRIKDLDGHQKKLKIIQEQATEESKHVAQLEVSLSHCKEELNLLAEKTEESKTSYEATITHKNQELTHQDNAIATLKSQLNSAMEELQVVQSSLCERDKMLVSSQQRISELEELHETSQQQLASLNQVSTKEKSDKEVELSLIKAQYQKMEKELVEKISQINELDTALKEVHMELRMITDKHTTTDEKLVLVVHDLQSKAEELENVRNRLRTVTSDFMEATRKNDQLQQTIENQTASIKKSEDRNDDLQNKVTNAQEELKQTLVQLSELENVLQESQTTAKAKEKEATELDRRLNVSEEELILKENVLKTHEKQLIEMDRTLKEKHLMLKQKTLQVAQLDMTLKEQRSELQQRLNALDSQLHQTQMELTDKTMEVSDLKAQLDKLQASDTDKTAKIGHLQKLLDQHNAVLTDKTSQLLDLEKSVQRHNELEDQVRQQTHELVALKEEECRLRDEVQSLKKEVIQRDHSQQSLMRELDNCHQLLAEKEADCTRLARELGGSQVREAQAEAKAAKEIRKASQLSEHQLKLKEQEIEKLQDKHAEELTVKEQELTQLRLAIRRSGDEIALKQNDVDRCQQRLVDYEQDALDVKRELQLQQEKTKELGDTLILKESEITRLEAKISGYERATFGMTPKRSNQSSSSRLGKRKDTTPTNQRPASVASMDSNLFYETSRRMPDMLSSSLLVPDFKSLRNHSSPIKNERSGHRGLRKSLLLESDVDHHEQGYSDASDMLLDTTPPSDLGLTLNQSSL